MTGSGPVVSIIALLIAILLPELKKARDAAKRVACASNLHQIAIASTAYESDNRGLLPQTQTTAGSVWQLLGAKVVTEWSEKDRPLNKYLQLTPIAQHASLTVPSPDVASVARCPADSISVEAVASQTAYQTFGTSYIYNYLHSTPATQLWRDLTGLAVGDVRNVSQTVFAGDYVIDYGIRWKKGIGTSPGFRLGPHQLDTGYGNAVFLDSHVAYVHFADEVSDDYLTGPDWTLIAY